MLKQLDGFNAMVFAMNLIPCFSLIVPNSKACMPKFGFFGKEICLREVVLCDGTIFACTCPVQLDSIFI